MTGEPMELDSLTDEQLVELMRPGLAEANWPVGQMIQVESRGIDCLASDPELQGAVKAQMDEWTARFREMLKSALPTFPIIDPDVTKAVNAWRAQAEAIQNAFRASEASTETDLQRLNRELDGQAADAWVTPAMGSVLDSPAVQDLPLDSDEVRHQEMVEITSAGFAASVAALQTNNESLREIVDGAPPKWMTYCGFWVGVVAAVIALTGLVIALKK